MSNPSKIKLALATLALSVAGLGAIVKFEDVRYTAYLDDVQVPTICVGSTRNVYLGQTATPRECEIRLQEDSTYAGNAIRRCLRGDTRLTQSQYDALVSFVFNVGGGAFCKSTLRRKIIAGECYGASQEFKRWNKAGGRVLRGLTRRRAAESEMYLSGC